VLLITCKTFFLWVTNTLFVVCDKLIFCNVDNENLNQAEFVAWGWFWNFRIITMMSAMAKNKCFHLKRPKCWFYFIHAFYLHSTFLFLTSICVFTKVAGTATRLWTEWFGVWIRWGWDIFFSVDHLASYSLGTLFLSWG